MIATATPKERRPCCAAKVDALGRLPIGWCGPDCIGRAEHLAAIEERCLVWARGDLIGTHGRPWGDPRRFIW